MTIKQAIKLLRTYDPDEPCAFALWDQRDVSCVAKKKGLVLNDDQIANVLEAVHENQDANHGINWDSIEFEIRFSRDINLDSE